MKRALYRLSLAAAMLVSPAFAKEQQPVYDLTGEISYQPFHPDTEAHATVDGRTYNAYCSANGNSEACTDTAGAFIVTFAHGSWTTLNAVDLGWDWTHSNMADPLLSRITANDNKPTKFQYRIMGVKTKGQVVPLFCVGGSEKQGKAKPQEGCFLIDPASVNPPRAK
jgi:hypothetical protein